jgi:hypothetical protein
MNRSLVLRVATVVVIAAVLAGLLHFAPRVAPATAKTYTLVLKEGALASGPSLISVNQGDTVTLNLASDRSGQLMIHGYEQELSGHEGDLAVADGGHTTFVFVASRSGRYMVHFHREDQHIEIAQIDVQPR